MKSKQIIYKISLILLFFAGIFLRFFNLDTTARFTRDESSDLVKIKQIIDQKDITLIGPTAEGNTGIFSSLTYYISLPFVYFSKNNPVSPAWASAFYGSVTILLIWIYFKKQKDIWKPIYFLPIVLTPFIQMSRWAWNPHFIPLWQILGILILSSNLPLNFFISGIIFGLTIHQHWYAVFSCLGMAVLILIKNKKIKPLLYFLTGLFISICPFILFDLTHPPGLFFSRMLYFSPVAINQSLNIFSIFSRVLTIPFQFFNYLTFHQPILTWLIILLTTILIIKNFYQKKSNLNLFLIPILFQFLGLSIISTPIEDRYLIPGIIFFIIWLSYNAKNIFAKILIITLIFSGLYSLPKIIFQNDWTNNLTALTEITQIIENKSSSINKFNLVVLQSPDQNTKGSRFRDLLKIKNINPLPPEDYSNPNSLFVITYSDNWEKIKTDPAYEMDHFRKNQPDQVWKIKNSQWFLYQVNK